MKIKQLHATILVLLAVLLVVGGGYLWTSWGGEEDEVVSGESVEVVEDGKGENEEGDEGKTEVVGGGEIDTSDWKIYRDEKNGFSLKYPKGWRVVEPKGTNSVFYVISPEEFFRVMSVSVYPNSNLADVLDEEFPGEDALFSEKRIEVNNFSGIERKIEAFGPCKVYVYLPVSNRILRVHYQSAPELIHCKDLQSSEFGIFLDNLKIE